MRCTKCKSEIDDYDITCPYCGQKTSELYIENLSELKQRITYETPTPESNFSKIILRFIR